MCRQSAVSKIGHHIAGATCVCNDCQAAIVDKNLNMKFKMYYIFCMYLVFSHNNNDDTVRVR